MMAISFFCAQETGLVCHMISCWVCAYLILLTCALQEGGFMTNQAPPRPFKKKSYTVGQTYCTVSGRVFTMTIMDDSSDATMTTASVKPCQQVQHISQLTADDDIPEVKTPTSPSDLPAVDNRQMISVAEGLDFCGARVSVKSFPATPTSSLDKLSPISGRKSPFMAAVVCWLVGWWSAWKQAWKQQPGSKMLTSAALTQEAWLNTGSSELVQTECLELQKTVDIWGTRVSGDQDLHLVN